MRRLVGAVILLAGILLPDPAFAVDVSQLQGAVLRIMPLGDSITFGFGGTTSNGYREPLRQLLVADGAAVDFVGSMHSGTMADNDNEGHSGWLIADIDGVEDKAIAARPNVVLLHAGTNDIDRGVDVATAPQRLAHLVDDIVAHDPGVVVVVALILPNKDPVKQARVVQYNTGVKAAMAQRPQVVLAGMDTIPVTLLADNLHPGDAGYQAMADVWHTALQGAASRITAPAAGAPKCLDTGHFNWFDRGTYASGVAPAANVRLADFDGDGRDDYLVVHDDGSVDAYRNVGGDAPGQAGFVALGRVAAGVGAPGARVRFADLDGDKRADYLVVGDTGAITAYRNNGGDSPGHPGWIAEGQIAGGVPGATPATVRFADLNADGRDDYVVLAPNGGPVTAWLKGSGAAEWQPQGQIATGTGEGPVYLANFDCDGRADYLVANGPVKAYLSTGGTGWINRGQVVTGGSGQVAFADLNGDGRDDYVLLDPATGALHAYFNNGGDN